VKILKSEKHPIKQHIILLTILNLFFNCSVKEKPQFLNVDNIKVVESTSKNITVSADAYFLNPNDIGGELKTDEIKIFVNDNEMASVSTKSFNVPAKKEFSIPLQAKIGSLFSKKVKVQYKGDIIYKVFGFSYRYNVDETETIKIK